eukprot:COSAG01_NODE_6484_length_3638_cov_100.861260_6_plen_107_part_00
MGMGGGLLLENYWHYPSRGARQAHGGSRGPAGSCLAAAGQLLMGPQTYAQVSDPKTVFGDFNEVLNCKCLVVLDEMLYAGNHAVANQFKSLITEDQIRINPKYGKP